ncbi:MAG: DegT/DnrJ/EryC1/StrS family aminotransferase [Acidobacteriia bacterium]|nr:DegT/DnrJ/EryC1/StrS family aminotransferase [Terriglobia bacterium]
MAKVASHKVGAAVPLLDLQRQYAAIREEVLAAIERVCASQRFILGEEVAALEREISAYIGASETVACASGTDALWLSLLALGVGPGDEVITTPFSFFASAGAVVRAGARPVFVDIDPLTFNLDPAKVERKLAAYAPTRVKAIIPVHLYGQVADPDAFQRIAIGYGFAVLEDAAQAFGAAWRGKRAGSLGAAAAFSFYPTKNLSAFGDAGCITTSDPKLAERLRHLRVYGSAERYFHEEVGWNSRLDAIQAAVLRVKLKYVDRWNAQRGEHAATYDRLLADAGLTRGEPAPVRLPQRAREAHHTFHQYVLRAQKRDQLRKFLAERSIGTEIYYPLPLHLQRALAYLGYADGDFPEAERAAQEVLALPVFPELREDEQRTVVDAIAEFYS